jgi:hypothetical protein
MEVTPIEVTDGERAIMALAAGDHSRAADLIVEMDERIAELEAVLERLVNIVDVGGDGSELEDFFVVPVREAHAALAKGG